jgi:hypothetical protein
MLKHRAHFGGNMKTLAMATLIAGVITPAYAQETSYENAQSFITEYKDGSNIYARLYIRGVGEGLSWYNSLVDTEHMGKPAYCEPEHLALVDAQYVSMMRAFLTKYPNTKTMPVPLVLLYALKDTFPCP